MTMALKRCESVYNSSNCEKIRWNEVINTPQLKNINTTTIDDKKEGGIIPYVSR